MMTSAEKREVRRLAGLLISTHKKLRRAMKALGLEIARGHALKSTVDAHKAIDNYFSMFNETVGGDK